MHGTQSPPQRTARTIEPPFMHLACQHAPQRILHSLVRSIFCYLGHRILSVQLNLLGGGLQPLQTRAIQAGSPVKNEAEACSQCMISRINS
jgi:hypothetical protein